MTRRREFNLANTITVLRILALPLGVYALFKNGGDDSHWRMIAWSIYFIIGLSDMLDGKLARSRNSVTEFGKLLDPIADKAMMASAMISLSILGYLPWWITIVILLREIGITIWRLRMLDRVVVAANRGGKIKTFFQGFGVGFYVWPLPQSWFWFRDGFMGVAIILTIVTGIVYIRSAYPKAKS